MELKINNQENEILAVLTGRLDTVASTPFATDMKPLLDNADKTIVLNCERLEFISSSGLRLFLTLRKATLAAGGKVIIEGMTADVKQVFTITGFLSLFDFR